MTNNSEMSLDDVLSSIKKMVIENESPVFELTEMIDENGKIVKITNEQELNSNNMSSFLELVQKNAASVSKTDAVLEVQAKIKEHVNMSSKNDALYEMVKEMLFPILQKWINENVSQISKEIINNEIKKVSAEIIKDWMQLNLPNIVAKQVEFHMGNIFKK